MNNPLLEKAKYYLNESNRLTEELDTQIQYSAVLEAVLEELVGTENFLAIIESSPELKKRYTKAALQDINKRTGTLEKLSNAKAGSIGDWHRADQRAHRALALPTLDAHYAAYADRNAEERKFIKISGEEANQQHKIERRTKGIRRATS